MLKFSQLEPIVEYYMTYKNGNKVMRKVRINENGFIELEGYCGFGVWDVIYNQVIDAIFEPCEWVPKIGETYYSPDYSEYEINGVRYLCTPCHFLNDINDYQIKNNVGWYKTPKEAHDKSLEMGWTL